MGPKPLVKDYWSLPSSEVLRLLGSGPEGLSRTEAARRLEGWGPNEIHESRALSGWGILFRQVKSPLVLLLVFAASVSFLTSEWMDGAIVLSIVLATVGLGFWREYDAQTALEELQARVQAKAKVVRGGELLTVPARELVPGDVFLLTAGSLVPADGILLEAADCFVSEAVLTGESFPVAKKAGTLEASTPIPRRDNSVFQGTNVRSGTARCLAAATGAATEFGAIAHRLSLRPPETEFDKGIKRFGNLLMTTMLVMVLLVFTVHMFQGRPVLETFLFAVALAVGLSPELLPAVLSVNLSRGARDMADRGVLVRRLNAIENLGSMDVLCTDKTGTLTEGVVALSGAYDREGADSTQVLEWAALNAGLETGLDNPLDEAILRSRPPDLAGLTKKGEIPFDFTRKRVSVVTEGPEGTWLTTKGAFRHILEICAAGPGEREGWEALYEAWSGQGIRVLALARRKVEAKDRYGFEDERDMVFCGFLTFLDRPKAGAAGALADLKRLGVSVKIITGDVKPVALHVAQLVGLTVEGVLTGPELDALPGDALWREVERTNLFVEVGPSHKERIILALRRGGHVVGFMGDGVNDAPAMHGADTSLSVEGAVDVAKDAADFVLLKPNLEVIRRGIEEGRRTFANTLKYVLTTTSANLGNMASMAAASLFLPFLPLTAGQVLLNNFLSDVPAFGLAGDRVDEEMVEKPRRWDIRFIGRFMVEFGVLSSLFDLLTFGVLILMFRVPQALFQTAWFTESLLTELAVALVLRTRRVFFRSRPGTFLLAATLVLGVLALGFSYLPFSGLFGFTPMPLPLLAMMAGITAAYLLSTEFLKAWFYRKG